MFTAIGHHVVFTAIGAFIYIATGLIKEFFFPRRKKNTFNAS